nr:FliM/FliN family flagellar motor switch protein [Chthonobacter rhizosphaerae]
MALSEALLTHGLAPRAVSNGLARAVAVPVTVTLGGVDLPLSAVRDLAVGDVVLLDARVVAAPLALRAAGRVLRLAPAAGGMAVAAVEIIRRTGTGAFSGGTAVDDAERGRVAAGSLESLTVIVDVDVGSVEVSLADLESWRVGALVPLPLPVVESGLPVTLSVNGLQVAAGDLVRIDDRLAVRLSRLAGG